MTGPRIEPFSAGAPGSLLAIIRPQPASTAGLSGCDAAGVAMCPDRPGDGLNDASRLLWAWAGRWPPACGLWRNACAAVHPARLPQPAV